MMEWIYLFVILVIYFLPSIGAIMTKHHNAGPIVVINLFLGWTFIGWVVALAMAYSKRRDETK